MVIPHAGLSFMALLNLSVGTTAVCIFDLDFSCLRFSVESLAALISYCFFPFPVEW